MATYRYLHDLVRSAAVSASLGVRETFFRGCRQAAEIARLKSENIYGWLTIRMGENIAEKKLIGRTVQVPCQHTQYPLVCH